VGGVAKRLKVYFDGGCRPNPGPIEAAVVARGVTHLFAGLGSGTSEDAEWRALFAALKHAQALGGPFELIGDNAHVIAQANGTLKARSEAAQAHLARFRELAASGAPARIRWTPRSQNLAGIALDALRRYPYSQRIVGR
jgi:ribonuclease HI